MIALSEKTFEKRFKQIYEIAKYLLEHGKEMIEKQKKAEENFDEDGFVSFCDCPGDYLPGELYRTMSSDLVDIINEMLCGAVHSKQKKFTQAEIMNWLLRV